MFCFDVTTGAVEGDSGKGGPHLQAPETRRRRCCFTDLENPAAHPSACPIRMYEEGAYLGRILLGIEESIFTAGAVVAAKERLALAPAPASGYDLVLTYLGFSDKIRAILDQLSIHPKNQFQSLLSLLQRIVARLQSQDGCADETLERRNVGHDSLPDQREHGFAE